MSTYWFKLDENKVPHICTLEEYAEWSKEGQEVRIMKQSYIKNVFISTVFLGIDHSYDDAPSHIPVLFETMIDGMGSDQELERYVTYGEAIKGHWKHVGRSLQRVITGEWKPYN